MARLSPAAAEPDEPAAAEPVESAGNVGPVEPPRPAHPPRRWRILERLGAAVIAFELVAVFLCAIGLMGLEVLPAGFALGGFAVFAAASGVALWTLRFAWGGWVVLGLEIALVAAGLLHPALYFVGGVFLAIWAFCLVKGIPIDRERARVVAEYLRADAA